MGSRSNRPKILTTSPSNEKIPSRPIEAYLGTTSDAPPPNLYSVKAAKQRLNLQTSKISTTETVNMDKMSDPRDREGYLYVKTPKDYQLGYHQKIQEGRSKTTLQ